MSSNPLIHLFETYKGLRTQAKWSLFSVRTDLVLSGNSLADTHAIADELVWEIGGCPVGNAWRLVPAEEAETWVRNLLSDDDRLPNCNWDCGPISYDVEHTVRAQFANDFLSCFSQDTAWLSNCVAPSELSSMCPIFDDKDAWASFAIAAVSKNGTALIVAIGAD